MCVVGNGGRSSKSSLETELSLDSCIGGTLSQKSAVMSEPNITFTHCSVIVSKHTEFCPDIAEFCLVKYFSASLIMHILYAQFPSFFSGRTRGIAHTEKYCETTLY